MCSVVWCGVECVGGWVVVGRAEGGGGGAGRVREGGGREQVLCVLDCVLGEEGGAGGGGGGGGRGEGGSGVEGRGGVGWFGLCCVVLCCVVLCCVVLCCVVLCCGEGLGGGERGRGARSSDRTANSSLTGALSEPLAGLARARWVFPLEVSFHVRSFFEKKVF